MANSPEDLLIAELRRRVEGGDTDGIRIHYREVGGMPGTGAEARSITISGSESTAVLANIDNDLSIQPLASGPQVEDMLVSLGVSASELVPRSQANFLQDSRLGWIKIELDNREADLFFLVDERDRAAQNANISPSVEQVVASLAQMLHRRLNQED
jgi:hypothetical protein